MALTEKIGNVTLNLDYYGGKDLYCDGEVEDELLDIVKNHREGEFERIIAQRCKWPILYHLSKHRGNCIEWLDIAKTDKVLEVGSGCGAVTGFLADKCESLTCIELSKQRSMINAERNKYRNNITVYVGNFQDISTKLDEKYDLITLIGVLEYGQLYISSKNPYVDFLSGIRAMLKPGGRLVIAIENKLGMKYWAGCREDHVGRLYESIENYPGKAGIHTFTKKELGELLDEAGFKDRQFYYPYPDYKFAAALYSDDYLPHKGELNNNMRNFDMDRVVAFDETKAFDNIIENGMFPEFSNSYLIVAKEGTV